MNALFLLLAFQLLYAVNQIHFPWETGIPGVAPANFLLVFIAIALAGRPDQLGAHKAMLRNGMLLFFGAMVVAFVWGQLSDPRDLLADATYLKNGICFPLFYFIYLKCRQDEKRTRLLIIWIMVIAAVAGLEAIHEGVDYGIGTYNQFHRASGPFGLDWHDANRAGVYYAIFAPMFVALALFLRGKVLWRLAALGGILVLAGGALFTYSRQAYILMLLGAALLLVRKNVVLAAVVSVALISSASFLPESVFQRVEETQQQKSDGTEVVDDSTASRWEIWSAAMQMWRENPMGIGLNHFKPRIGSYCKYEGMDAHNFYVLTLAEMGPLGLASFLFLVWNLFKLSRFLRQSAPRGDPELHALTIGFTVTTLCMCLGGLYGSPNLEGAVMGTYWALAGLLERLIVLRLQSQQGEVVRGAEPSLEERFPLAAHVHGPTHSVHMAQE